MLCRDFRQRCSKRACCWVLAVQLTDVHFSCRRAMGCISQLDQRVAELRLITTKTRRPGCIKLLVPKCAEQMTRSFTKGGCNLHRREQLL
jgi:hypothetical protein